MQLCEGLERRIAELPCNDATNKASLHLSLSKSALLTRTIVDTERGHFSRRFCPMWILKSQLVHVQSSLGPMAVAKRPC